MIIKYDAQHAYKKLPVQRLFKGCSPLQNRNGLISLKPAIAYFAYTYR